MRTYVHACFVVFCIASKGNDQKFIEMNGHDFVMNDEIYQSESHIYRMKMAENPLTPTYAI